MKKITQLSYAIRMSGICKRYGNLLANDNIDFEARPGEIHALLGENGAGKTTLMNILFGLIQPEKGSLEIHGNTVQFSSPRDAIAYRLAMVHQQFIQVPKFKVIENVILGLRNDQGVSFSLSTPAKKLKELSSSYGLAVDPWAVVGNLSVGEQQRVEIIKALYRDVDILILDEPTSVLTPNEVEQLFNVLNLFVKKGHTVIFISHKLHEVLTISQRITVLRDGKKVGTVNTKETSATKLANMMVGRDISLNRVYSKTKLSKEQVIELENLSVKDDYGLTALSDLNLTVNKGEILGIAGVDGNGQRELVEVIVGIRKVESGRIKMLGEDITNINPKKAIQKGIVLIPADRRGFALLPDLPVWRNLILGLHQQVPYSKYGFLNFQAIQDIVFRLLKQFNVRPADPQFLAGSLSGGNLQKLIFAREIEKKPKFLIAFQPTYGLDIGTTEYVRELLIRERDRGVAVLLISTDLQEIQSISDRITVMYEGKLMGTTGRDKVTTEQLGLMMAGFDSLHQKGIQNG